MFIHAIDVYGQNNTFFHMLDVLEEACTIQCVLAVKYGYMILELMSCIIETLKILNVGHESNFPNAVI